MMCTGGSYTQAQAFTFQESPSQIVTTIGSLVSLRTDIGEPHNGWQQVRPNAIGIVRDVKLSNTLTAATVYTHSSVDDYEVETQLGNIQVTVDFPNQSGYTALASELIPALGVGMIVEPGPDWRDGNLNDGTQGKVLAIDERGRTTLVRVRWDNSFENRYFWGPRTYQLRSVAYGAHPVNSAPPPIFLSHKPFAEGFILAELSTQVLEANGIDIIRRDPLPQTNEMRQALQEGALDLYPEYTGTALLNFFQNRGIEALDRSITNDLELSRTVVAALDRYVSNIHWLCPAPANNTYALAVRNLWAEEHDVYTLQDLAIFIQNGGDVTLAGNQEFLSRPDGLSAFETTYDFETPAIHVTPATNASYQSALALRDALEGTNVGMVFATDGTVQAFDLLVLSDTLGAQPVYNPAITVRDEVIQHYPHIAELLCPVFSTLDNFALSSMNGSYTLDGLEPRDIALNYLCTLDTEQEISTAWFADNPLAAERWQTTCSTVVTAESAEAR